MVEWDEYVNPQEAEISQRTIAGLFADTWSVISLFGLSWMRWYNIDLCRKYINNHGSKKALIDRKRTLRSGNSPSQL